MRPVLRFLLWLLIVALPLQGGAGSMLPCVQLSQPVQHSAHCVPDAAQQKKALDRHAHAKCSHCTACASVLGAPLATDLLLTMLSAPVPLAADPAMSGHIPATLERPPQSA